MHARIGEMTSALRKRYPDKRLLFAAVDVGSEPYW